MAQAPRPNDLVLYFLSRLWIGCSILCRSLNAACWSILFPKYLLFTLHCFKKKRLHFLKIVIVHKNQDSSLEEGGGGRLGVGWGGEA